MVDQEIGPEEGNPKSKNEDVNGSDDSLPLPPIPSELKKYLEDPEIPEQKRLELREAIRHVQVRYSSHYRGPLPSPNMFSGYNKVIPNGAERIFEWTREQSLHRMGIEHLAVSEQLKQDTRGQHYGLIIAVLGLVSATVLGALGHEVTASVIGGGTLVALVTVFVTGKKAQRADLEEKDPD